MKSAIGHLFELRIFLPVTRQTDAFNPLFLWISDLTYILFPYILGTYKDSGFDGPQMAGFFDWLQRIHPECRQQDMIVKQVGSYLLASV